MHSGFHAWAFPFRLASLSWPIDNINASSHHAAPYSGHPEPPERPPRRRATGPRALPGVEIARLGSGSCGDSARGTGRRQGPRERPRERPEKQTSPIHEVRGGLGTDVRPRPRPGALLRCRARHRGRRTEGLAGRGPTSSR
jgi:hypothetical protein